MTDARAAVRTVADLRTGTIADIAAVDAVMRSAFDPRYGEAWTPAQCRGMMTLPGVWLTLAQVDGAVVGFALTRAIGGDAELLLLAVDPTSRGRGIGAAMVRFVIVEAGARGSPRLCLEMRADNPATRMYLREGFVKCGERRHYYTGRDGARYDAHTYVCATAPDDF